MYTINTLAGTHWGTWAGHGRPTDLSSVMGIDHHLYPPPLSLSVPSTTTKPTLLSGSGSSDRDSTDSMASPLSAKAAYVSVSPEAAYVHRVSGLFDSRGYSAYLIDREVRVC